jgi:outer membrane receptor protein involved in Fe transport
VSGGGYSQDAMPRPIGIIPGSPGQGTPYPAYGNEGTKQPKLDARVDYDFPNQARSMSFSGGFAGTSGIMHSGIGPFSIDNGSTMSYGKFNYNQNALHVQAFLNVLNGNAMNLLTVSPAGTPIPLDFDTKTFDIEGGHSLVTGSKNVLTYGGNVRMNRFALSIAPGEDHRTETGAYVQDEYAANKYLRIVAGARVDKFTSIDKAVFSPRVAFLLRPHDDHTFRLSYNRAFRAPSMINNNLNVTIANPLPLAAFGLPGQFFLVPTDAVGNPGLTEEHADSFELSYTGIVNKNITVSWAYYQTRLDQEILFTQSAEWSPLTPPPGWTLNPAFWAAAQSSAHFPQTFTYLNLGLEKNQGFEFGIDANAARGVSAYMNASYQKRPVVNFGLNETNHPPTYRFNAGFRYDEGTWNGSFNVASQTSAFFQDVLDARFSGTTPAYMLVNLSVGTRFGKDKRYQPSIKVTNLANIDVQQHIFGDVLKRTIVGELRIQLPK